MARIAVFTDNDREKVSGVTTTLREVVRCAPPDLDPRVYTASSREIDEPGYRALTSRGLGLPWYPEMRIYRPRVSDLHRMMLDHRVEAIHVTTPGPIGLTGRYLAKRLGLPIIGSYHTHLGDYVRMYSGSRWLAHGLERYMRWFYSPCSRVLVPSAATRDMLRDLGYPERQLGIWSRGIDTSRFSPRRRSVARRASWGVHGDEPVVLYAGRLSSEKGLALLPPLADLLARRGLPFRLVIAGDGPMRHELETRLPGAVFLGPVPHDEMGEVMASADVFAFPSATDALGNVVLEAQASGVPVLVTDGGGPKENVMNGRTGWVLAPDAVDAFANRLEQWFRAPDLRTSMSQYAAEHGARRDWASSLAPLYDAWRHALATASTRTPAARAPRTAYVNADTAAR